MIPVVSSFQLGASNTGERQKLAEAATQFEAIFARQMLASARQTRFDEGGLFDSEGMDTFRQMMDDRFADLLAQGGSLGFAKSIETQLAAQMGPEAKG